MIPSLPQQDPSGRALRHRQLAEAQQAYVWNHTSRVAPLGITQSLPQGQKFPPRMLGGAATVVLELVDNVLDKLSRVLSPGGAALVGESIAVAELGAVEALVVQLLEHRRLLGRIVESHLPGHPKSERTGLVERVEDRLERVVERMSEVLHGGRAADAPEEPEQDPLSHIELVLKTLLGAAAKGLLQAAGLFGPAGSLYSYVRLFSIIRTPDIASTFEDDLEFARLRLAGANPMVIGAVGSLPAAFPVTDAQLQAINGPEDSLERAGREGRLFLCDYSMLAGVPLSTFPDGQKYMSAAFALFSTPPAGQADRRLRPVAIQLGQVPNRSTPVIVPGDPAWPLAKLHVQVADGNHHEMISHLGRTHLLIEAFAMVTHRQLAPEHPLHVLLMPHFEGTLAINSAAESTLIAPGGFVDRLLAGTIAGTTALAVDCLTGLDVPSAAFPADIAARGLADKSALPDYPYRDDGQLLWGALSEWVRDYLSVYYSADEDIAGDTELAAWVAELGSPGGAGLQGLDRGGRMGTFDGLVETVTQVIFTASVQHAAVNFPQSTLMSFLPAYPLAAYAPAPTSTDQDGEGAARLAHLAPLQDAFAQQLLLRLLGGVFYTRLGDYDRYVVEPTFADPRVAPLLSHLQDQLRRVEAVIGRRNLHRTPYTTLLPTAVPQSINI